MRARSFTQASITLAFALPIALALGASQLGCGAVQTDGGGGPLEAGSQGDGRTNSSSSSSDAATASDVVVRADGGVTETVERTLCKSDLDCVRSDAVGTCVALVGGTFHVCAFPPAPPQPCVDAGVPNGQFENECCGKTTNPCLTGVCTLQVACGGAFFVPHNVCVSDECSKNADCGARGVCLPVGVGNATHRTCLSPNDCVADAECGPGGACILLGAVGPATECAAFSCGPGPVQVAGKMACVYGGDCRDDSDCPKQHCEATTVNGQTRMRCAAGVRTDCAPPP